jgi:hypothetical protein
MMKSSFPVVFLSLPAFAMGTQAIQLFETYCLDCHDSDTQKGNLDLESMLGKAGFDGTLVFENLITGKMPPAEKKQPAASERRALLEWLAARQGDPAQPSYRRLNRHEFVHSINDLLGIEIDLADEIPEDRGAYYFDTDRRIQLGQEMLTKYFSVADRMLGFAFPEEGFPPEQVWVTNKLMDSHKTYNIYHRPYEEGTLFSWTRANNGNSYSFFWDNFEPPAPGWYDLTFEAAKVGDFAEDISIQVHAGKYYYADDRPQPQRLLDVISVGSRELKPYTVRAFLRPGESVSTHSFSQHNFRNRNPKTGAYIKQLTARGALLAQWPPEAYQKVFAGLPITAPGRPKFVNSGYQSNLQKIGGKVTVSSFQVGMEKEKMQDGSNLTFWHTRFKPGLAKPPHYVIFENPGRKEIQGLSYSTWIGGNGNGLVHSYAIHFSDDGQEWGNPIMDGGLDIRLSNTQPIIFPKPTTAPYIKFLVTGSKSLDGRFFASIGKLDVLLELEPGLEKLVVKAATDCPDDLKSVIRRFAQKAFSSGMEDVELEPYFSVSLENLRQHGDFIRAAKAGLKAILCSPRFLMAPGEHANPSYAKAAALSKALWLSVPDGELLSLAKTGTLSGQTLQSQIDRMLQDERSRRFVNSFCNQWLNLRSWNKVTPSLKLYPLYDDLLNHYLPFETKAYFRHLLIENQPATHLIDSNYSFLNQRLARHYGIAGLPGQELRKVSFPKDIPRGGILTMGSVLKVTTDGFATSPILRGAWISKNIVGIPISPPPDSVPVLEPDHSEAATLKEQIAQHTTNKACYACHKDIDPYGFALENFDASGQWREKYRVSTPHRGTFQYRPEGYSREAGAVDASGEIGGGNFQDIHGLKQILLSGHRKLAYNFAKKFFEYTNGYSPTLNQRFALYDMTGEDPNDNRMKDLVSKVLLYLLEGENP